MRQSWAISSHHHWNSDFLTALRDSLGAIQQSQRTSRDRPRLLVRAETRHLRAAASVASDTPGVVPNQQSRLRVAREHRLLEIARSGSRHLLGNDRSRPRKRASAPSSATSAGEPRRAFDRGVWIVTRRDRRRLRRCPGGLGWHHADADHRPFSVLLCRDPAGIRI